MIFHWTIYRIVDILEYRNIVFYVFIVFTYVKDEVCSLDMNSRVIL